MNNPPVFKSRLHLLPPVSSTLRIPLAGRALGDELFPQMAVNDRFAAATLAALNDDGSQWVQDLYSVYGVLARTRYIRRQALDFIEQYPSAQVINIGCGLSQYYQWLDNGQIQMLDVDLPGVIEIRRQLLPPLNERQSMHAVNITDLNWWQQLPLPSQQDMPMLLIMEGLSMYLDEAHIIHILRTISEYMPAGSRVILDAFNYLAVGHSCWHPSLRQTGADITWGLRSSADLTTAHPRLHLMEEADVMAGFSMLNAFSCFSVTLLTGLPFYATYTLRLD